MNKTKKTDAPQRRVLGRVLARKVSTEATPEGRFVTFEWDTTLPFIE